MFTKKPDQGPSSSPAFKPADKPASEAAAPSIEKERSGSFMKSSGKMVPSIIGEDLTITGNVVAKGEIQVDGEIQGDVHCGSLIVGEKAHITGGIIADDVTVRGRITGSIRALRVSLQSHSHVDGDIFHQSLAIEQGAYFEGKSRRSDDPVSAGKTAAAQQKADSKPHSSAPHGGQSQPHAAA